MPYKIGDEPIRGFKLIRSLGGGNCGEVWLSTHMTGISAALKIIPLHDQDASRWLPAILEHKNIRHPNVLQINRTWLRDLMGNAFGLTQARPLPGWNLIIITELAAKSLGHRLLECFESQSPGIPRPELMDYMREAAKGIDYLGGQGIVHGAICPHNLLLHEGRLKISDVGHAWYFGKTNAANAATAGVREQPHRTSDQSLLAVTYHELRTGKLPCPNAALTGEMQTAIADNYKVATDLPEREQAVFARAAHVDPSQRFPSATAFIEALQVAQATAPPRWESGAFHRPV
jgi:eukaryotic-like serine/threonine-protein kinase